MFESLHVSLIRLHVSDDASVSVWCCRRTQYEVIVLAVVLGAGAGLGTVESLAG